MANEAHTNHRSIAVLEKLTYLAEDGPIAVTMLLKDTDGNPFILAMPRAGAMSIFGALLDMMQGLKKAGGLPDVPKSAEQVLRFDASRVSELPGEVLVLLDGESSAFLGRMSRIDARSLAALLTKASEPDAPIRTN
jgi:hypothetical protein